MPSFQNLQSHAYMALTTYRKNGVAVRTPVWFAQVGDALFCVTDPDAGKLKRIRNNSKVLVEPFTSSGKSLGMVAEASAYELTSEAEKTAANAALNKKYGIQKKLFEITWWFRKIKPAFFVVR